MVRSEDVRKRRISSRKALARLSATHKAPSYVLTLVLSNRLFYLPPPGRPPPPPPGPPNRCGANGFVCCCAVLDEVSTPMMPSTMSSPSFKSPLRISTYLLSVKPVVMVIALIVLSDCRTQIRPVFGAG